jgi:hypothetical protein
MEPLHGIDLDQYRTQAKELLALARAGAPEAIELIRAHHPERASLSSPLKLSDTQLVLARKLGFGSWAKLKSEVLFRKALHYLDSGKVSELGAILADNPGIAGHRCRIGAWYESGYFEGATLISHVAGNPIRCPLPPNILDVARAILEHGADPNVKTDAGWTTIGLILTGKQVADARVGVKLIDLLKSFGASDDIDGDDVLSNPLWNGGRATADDLARRGAKMDLRHAAALARIDVMERLIAEQPCRGLLDEALIYACQQGEVGAARLLLESGAKGDVILGESARSVYAGRATALHEAAYRGYSDVVRLLLEFGAAANVIEPTWRGTAMGWAEHGGHAEIAELLGVAAAEAGGSLST